METNSIVDRAMKIEGATFPQEVRYVYALAMQAPEETTFVELGTYCGRTLSVIAHAANSRKSRVFSIDNYQYDEPKALSSSPGIVRGNLRVSGVRQTVPIHIIEGDSRVVPEGVSSVGFLFVDSTHTKAHFDAEMASWLPLVVKGGIVACHDYDSPRWLEMTGVIDGWLSNSRYARLGLERRVIGFQKL